MGFELNSRRVNRKPILATDELTEIMHMCWVQLREEIEKALDRRDLQEESMCEESATRLYFQGHIWHNSAQECCNTRLVSFWMPSISIKVHCQGGVCNLLISIELNVQ